MPGFFQRDVSGLLHVAACVGASLLFRAESPVVMRVAYASLFRSSVNDASQTRF